MDCVSDNRYIKASNASAILQLYHEVVDSNLSDAKILIFQEN